MRHHEQRKRIEDDDRPSRFLDFHAPIRGISSLRQFEAPRTTLAASVRMAMDLGENMAIDCRRGKTGGLESVSPREDWEL